MPNNHQRPKDKYVNIAVDVPTGIHRMNTIDLMQAAGYSRSYAKKLIRKYHVWQPFDGNWVCTNENTWVNFLTRDVDYVLAIQPEPGTTTWADACLIRAIRANSTTFEVMKDGLGWQ